LDQRPGTRRPDTGPWLRAYRRVPQPALRLLCFPHAGAGGSVYQPWAEHLSSDVELWVARYPGREDRLAEPFASSLTELADEVAAAAARHLSDVPIVLIGHSMGAVVAYETTDRLESRHGVMPAALVVSARESPARAEPTGLHLLDDEALLVRCRDLGIAPDDDAYANPELAALLLPVLREDFRLLANQPMTPAKRVLARMLACVGDTDPACTPADMAGWADAAAGEFELRVLSGNHFYLFTNSVETLKALLGWLRSTSSIAVPAD
jgi:pyochelin biosynthesis protein PchC